MDGGVRFGWRFMYGALVFVGVGFVLGALEAGVGIWGLNL